MSHASVVDAWTWKSWLPAANQPGCDFPLQNLPFCVFSGANGVAAMGVGIGDAVLDVQMLVASEHTSELPGTLRDACRGTSLNALMACGKAATSLLRQKLMMLLREDAAPALRESLRPMLTPVAEAKFVLPVAIGDYTDFYASVHHATNVGSLFRPDQPLLPNYKFLPLGYHGRTSSIAVSGQAVVRPQGQSKRPADPLPVFGPTRQMDYEVEIGAYVGVGNELGRPVAVDRAESHLFGISLVNDWSARDLQAWEYQPLGPFLGKSFATTVSPWVVTMEALEPFRVAPAERPAIDPAPLRYLQARDISRAAIELTVEVLLRTERMRGEDRAPVRISSGNLRDLYWTFGQMVTHHTSNGCNLRVGDLLATGTISGANAGSEGSLLERTRRGSTPIELPEGETRCFLEDGDEVILRGFCERDGLPRIGLGECRGIVVPALKGSQTAD